MTATTQPSASVNRGEVAIAVRGLVAGYDGVPAVHGIDLTVHAGEVVALLGANGAGKSTTLLAVAGLVDLQAGRIEVVGASIGHSSARPAATARRTRRLARAGLALVPEDRTLFPTGNIPQADRLVS